MLLLLFLIFLIPVAVYCLVLASINRQPHPVMVSGVWDCIGLLFAATGFFLGVVPGIVTLLYGKTLRQLPFVEPRSGLEAFGNLLVEWWLVLLLYYAALVGGALAAVLNRRSKTIIYNIDPVAWERVFDQVLARFGLEQTRVGKHINIGAPRHMPELVGSGLQETFQEKPLPRFPTPRIAVVRVDVFTAFRNVTLHWEQWSPGMRDEMETELRRTLGRIETFDNPAASWFLGLGGGIITMAFLSVVVLVLLSLPRR